MPTWDYRCPKCGKVRTEVFRNAEERDRAVNFCGCGYEQPMIQLACSGSFILKGPGFHVNDYPKGKP